MQIQIENLIQRLKNGPIQFCLSFSDLEVKIKNLKMALRQFDIKGTKLMDKFDIFNLNVFFQSWKLKNLMFKNDRREGQFEVRSRETLGPISNETEVSVNFLQICIEIILFGLGI